MKQGLALSYVLKKCKGKPQAAKYSFHIGLLGTELWCNEIITYEINIAPQKAINSVYHFFLEWGLQLLAWSWSSKGICLLSGCALESPKNILWCGLSRGHFGQAGCRDNVEGR